MFSFPDVPTVPAEQTASADVHLRYPEICQNGRIAVCAVPEALGSVVWRHVMGGHPIMHHEPGDPLRIPLLTRLIVETASNTITLSRPTTGKGGVEFAHTCDESGEVDRILANMWVELSGTSGRVYGPPQADAPQVTAARVFAEHVFSRPLAPAGNRRVTRFDLPNVPPVPGNTQPWQPADNLLDLPPGATALDSELVADEGATVFGVHHTDSNQHVNSLVYPRLFEDAAVRATARHGRGAQLLARWCEVSYRKPCFAGESLRIVARVFELDGHLGVVGAFVDEADVQAGTFDRARAYVRLGLTE